MLKFSFQIVSATLGVILLVSTLIVSGPGVASACPAPPESLFSLYMKSDLVVMAEVRNERDVRITDEREDSFNVDVARDLSIRETYKGPELNELLFTRNEYRSKPETEPAAGIRIISFAGFGRNAVYQPSVGDKYLFFLSIDQETGKYVLASYQGVRSIGIGTEDIYKDRFEELAAILTRKENRAAEFGEWLVRLIEEPETLWDGAYVLARSFDRAEYLAENPGSTDELPSESEYGIYSSLTAESLSTAQKDRLAAVLYDSINEAVANGDNRRVTYDLVRIVGNWDRSRLAMYCYGLLQSIEPDNADRISGILELVANASGDYRLREISWEYRGAGYQDESGQSEPAAIEEEKPIDANDYLVDESEANQADQLQTVEFDFNAGTAEEDPADEASAEAIADRTDPAQLRQKLIGEFVDRFQILAAMSFQDMPDDQ